MSRFSVKKVAVLGAGVMGAQIAAHLVNLRVPVLLFDLPAAEGPKSGIAIKAIEGLKKLKPAPLGVPEDAALIEPANYEEHLALLKGCDLVIEAIAERMVRRRRWGEIWGAGGTDHGPPRPRGPPLTLWVKGPRKFKGVDSAELQATARGWPSGKIVSILHPSRARCRPAATPARHRGCPWHDHGLPGHGWRGGRRHSERPASSSSPRRNTSCQGV